MRNSRVDYDQIAPTYNRRFADDRPRGVSTALLSLAQELEAERILEVGCGTGRWLADLRPGAAQLYGLDFSAGMLEQARKSFVGARQVGLRMSEQNRLLSDLPRPYLTRGRAGRLPFPNASFDLVYCVNAIHHFDQQRDFVFQARRLLRPGGALAVIGFDPRQHRDKWYIFDYFDGAFATDLARFPSWGTVLDWMASAGLTRVEWRPVERIVDHKQGRAVLDDPFLQKDAASQLVLLSDKEYAAGLDKIRAALAAAEAAGETLTFPCEILVRALVGRVD